MYKFTLVSLSLADSVSDSAVECCHKLGVPDECIGICRKKKTSSEPSRKLARPRSLARGDDGVILGICKEWMQSKVVKKCRELSSTKGIHYVSHLHPQCNITDFWGSIIIDYIIIIVCL